MGTQSDSSGAAVINVQLITDRDTYITESNNYQENKMANKDDRGFEKTDMVMINSQTPNFQTTVKLVERNPAPNGLQLVNPDASGKRTQMDLVELAEHVRFLQEQARKVLEEARLNNLLHKTPCNFKKIPGSTYYVYKQKRNPDEEFISMISPSEWGASGPEFVANVQF